MNYAEALALYGQIAADAPHTKAQVHRIGNGEYVVIVNSVWLWSQEDWEKQARPYRTLPPLAL